MSKTGTLPEKSSNKQATYYSCCKDFAKVEKTRSFPFYRTAMRTCKLVLNTFRTFIKAMVDHKYFQQGILLAILINTLSLGVEYHDQPDELTSLVETSNLIFSIVFAVEMVFKLLAEGPWGYVSNGFNVFDGIIVILRYLN